MELPGFWYGTTPRAKDDKEYHRELRWANVKRQGIEERNGEDFRFNYKLQHSFSYYGQYSISFGKVLKMTNDIIKFQLAVK